VVQTTAKKGSILVIDDDREFQTLAKLILGAENYEIVSLYNGQAALDYLSKETPRLIILDIRMPRMNGIDFLKAYHASTDKPAPVILTSAVNPAVPGITSDNLSHMGTFLAKPFSPNALRTIVAEYLSEPAQT
jgi:CheY-like chemotaxis protein